VSSSRTFATGGGGGGVDASSQQADRMPAVSDEIDVGWYDRWDEEVLPDEAAESERRSRILAALAEDGDDKVKGPSGAKVYERKVDKWGRAYGLGKRKAAVARVLIKPGSGLMLVNKKLAPLYFDARIRWMNQMIAPFEATNTLCQFDVMANVAGGGKTGQAEAIKLGIARALQAWNPDFRPLLRKEYLLTRDPRVVEEKKAGRPKAHKRKQWVKR
jgi:small subunit ribosomal protein S9